MAKKKGMPLGTFLKRFSSEAQCQEHPLAERVCLSQMWVPSQKRLSNGRYQCAQSYLDEYSFRFSSRNFGPALLERLTLAVSLSRPAEQKG